MVERWLPKPKVASSRLVSRSIFASPFPGWLFLCFPVHPEVYPEAAKLKKQFDYAQKKAIPFISINGSTEIEGGAVNVKNLETGEQKAFELSDISGILGFIA